MADQEGLSLVWAALADRHRRHMLELLSIRPRSTGELVAEMPQLSRTMVMKHLDTLQAADMIRFHRHGRMRINELNPEPLQTVCETWLQERVSTWERSLARLKRKAEQKDAQEN